MGRKKNSPYRIGDVVRVAGVGRNPRWLGAKVVGVNRGNLILRFFGSSMDVRIKSNRVKKMPRK